MVVETTLATVLFGSILALALSQTPDVEFSILEELPTGTPIGNISTLKFPELTGQQRNTLRYGILNQGSIPGALFNIALTDGLIYVASRVDREELCRVNDEPQCILRVLILVYLADQSQRQEFVTADFKILDINDNGPEFQRERIILKVTEKNSVDTVLKITGAIDKDNEPDFKVKEYTMDKYTDIFKLTASETLDGSSDINLKLLKSLDREDTSEYEFTVTAYDGGTPPKSADLRVKVEVTDQNDNQPVFLNDTYHVTVDGALAAGQVIVRVSAVDADEGINSLITYDFSNIQKPKLEGFLKINSSSGEISVVGSLRPGLTEFIVEAQDGGSPRQKAQTSVQVEVISTGNIAPRISVTTLGASELNVVSVLEPAGRGHFVAFVDISDEDGDIADVTCHVNNQVFNMEPIPNKGYKITLQRAVDRELTDSYNVTVTCEDKGQPPLTASASIVIKLKDANDNRPEFSQTRYQRTMREGAKDREFVLQVLATDKDVGENGVVSYSIEPRFSNLFVIDKNGQIYAIGDLDRENNDVITFKVFATDNGKPQKLQNSATISVTLEDVNDNAPEFDQSIFRIKITEEVGGRRIIKTLKAKDKDVGKNAELEYFALSPGAEGAFTVEKNGSIICTRTLDREDKTNYTFPVMVRDNGHPRQSSSATVVIDVEDINDNYPSILFPKSKNHSILFTTFPETGVVLSKIIAYDDDAGDNGSLKFTIVSGNEDRAFEISENTGEIQITSSSRVKNSKVYNVGFVVSDRGMPPKANTTTLRIEFKFENTTHELLVEENQQEDYIIIVAVVGAVTVVFSTLIIVAICIVFRNDRHSRPKSSTALKPDLQNLHAPDVLNEEKTHHSPENPPSRPTSQTFSLNDLSSPPDYISMKQQFDGNLFDKKSSSSDMQNKNLQDALVRAQDNQQTRGKNVSFSLDQNDVRSTSPRHKVPMSTFGVHPMTSRDDMTYTQRSPRQCDDVTSDTSGDTNTDSGRGHSEDDVNIDQIMKDDVNPRFTPQMRSIDASRRGQTRASHHVRFAQYTDKVGPPQLPPKTSNQSQSKSSSQHPMKSSTPIPNNHNINSSSRGPRMLPDFRDVPLPDYRDLNSKTGNTVTLNNSSKSVNMNNSREGNLNFVPHRNTSLDDDATTTTSGSYVINPDDVKIETFVGSDIIV